MVLSSQSQLGQHFRGAVAATIAPIFLFGLTSVFGSALIASAGAQVGLPVDPLAWAGLVWLTIFLTALTTFAANVLAEPQDPSKPANGNWIETAALALGVLTPLGVHAYAFGLDASQMDGTAWGKVLSAYAPQDAAARYGEGLRWACIFATVFVAVILVARAINLLTSRRIPGWAPSFAIVGSVILFFVNTLFLQPWLNREAAIAPRDFSLSEAVFELAWPLLLLVLVQVVALGRLRVATDRFRNLLSPAPRGATLRERFFAIFVYSAIVFVLITLVPPLLGGLAALLEPLLWADFTDTLRLLLPSVDVQDFWLLVSRGVLVLGLVVMVLRYTVDHGLFGWLFNLVYQTGEMFIVLGWRLKRWALRQGYTAEQTRARMPEHAIFVQVLLLTLLALSFAFSAWPQLGQSP